MYKIARILTLLCLSFILVSCKDFLSFSYSEYQIKDVAFGIDDDHHHLEMTMEERINLISLEVMKSNVTVITQVYSPLLFLRANEQKFFGSGVIFYENEDFYYVLTNQHVVAQTKNTTSATYQIVDYQNKVYDAYLYEGSKSVDDDLAIVFFEKEDKEYPTMIFNQHELNVGELVIAIGQPNGQKNTITFGEIEDFTPTHVKNRYGESIVRDFLAIQHSAYVDSGSSGGMLLNYNLQLIGINFAGAEEDDVHLYTFAIPVSIILSYLARIMNQA